MTIPKKITRDHVKLATSFVVGAAVKTTVKAIIKNNTNEPESKLQAAKIEIASIALGSMVADMAKTHTDTKVDELAELIADTRKDIENFKTQNSH